uniref:VWFC domain-containing protein n=1 Tax=Magallana gigas TaxID=29159 RepID=A0A8W8MMY7_MAGGI
MGSIGVFILLTLFIETGSVPLGFGSQVGTKSRNCTYKGIEYPPGSFKTHDCKECVCAGDGEMECTETKCFDYPCVDKVRRPGDCCPMCPNGQNCKAPDGTVVRYEEEYAMSENVVCVCDKDQWAELEASCKSRK